MKTLKNFRIVEKTYGDGHKDYVAQKVLLNFGLFKIWQNYIMETVDYGYATINMICCGKTFESCKEQLIESLRQQKEAKLQNKIVNKKFLEIYS